MKAICYHNTKLTLPNWNPNDQLNEECPLGFAYESGDFYVHMYGRGDGLYTVSPGITAIEGKTEGSSLEQWAVKRFGAENIQTMCEEVGVTHPSIWRPGLYTYDELRQGLHYLPLKKEDEDQALFLLLQKLINIFTYIEPANCNLSCYGHRIRELIILASTEFENQCRNILRANNISPQGKDYMSKDFVKLNALAHLTEYEIMFKPFANLRPFKPFDNWNEERPTQSLVWYDKYNRVKHDRTNDFSAASLETALNAIAANIILYSVQFGPYLLSNLSSVLSSYFNQYIHLSLVNPDITTFYIPKVKLNDIIRKDYFVCDAFRERFIKPWTVISCE